MTTQWIDYVGLHELEAGTLVEAPGLGTQRLLDLIMAPLAVLALLPLMLIIALLVWASDGGPVFFTQVRVGRMGRPFRCWKFRSMAVDAEQLLAAHLDRDPLARADWEASHKLRCDPRVTGVGRFLRASSLDELPQLINVLAGEMSLVGPRPIVTAEIGRYGAHFVDYCRCRPGITGLWQVSGRSDLSYQRRVELDAEYARSRSAWLDAKIMAATLPAVFARRGSY